MPEFSLLLMDRTTWLHARNIHTGKPIVLFYFSPYCPYCKAQTKEIIEDMDKLKNIQFYFVASSPLSAAKMFYNEYQLTKYSNIVTGIDTANVIQGLF